MSGFLIPGAHKLSICCKCQAPGYGLMNDGYLDICLVCFFHLLNIPLLSERHRGLGVYPER